jgi:uncharacterized protein YfkK (UPF0435 family)
MAEYRISTEDSKYINLGDLFSIVQEKHRLSKSQNQISVNEMSADKAMSIL